MSTSLITSASGLSKEDQQTVRDWMVEDHSIMKGKIRGTIIDASDSELDINPGETIILPTAYYNNAKIVAGTQLLHRVTLGSLSTNQFYGPNVATFSTESLPGYEKFTTDNFALSPVTFKGKDASTTFSYSLTYDASAGSVTIKNNVSTSADGGYHHCEGTVTVVCFYVA